MENLFLYADYLSFVYGIDNLHNLWLIVVCSLLDTRTLKEIGLTEKPTTGTRLMFRVAGKTAKVTLTNINPEDLGLETAERKQREKKERQRVGSEREDMIRSLRRTYQTVMERCKCLGVDRMLTLTFQENITELDKANLALTEFLRLARKKYGSDFQYVIVPEKQKRGAIHYHFGINKFYQWSTILAIWRLAIKKSGVSEQTGGIFINKNPCEGSIVRMSKYLAKYFLKGIKNAQQNSGASLNDLFSKGDKRYYSSKLVGEQKPRKQKVYSGGFLSHHTNISRCYDFLKEFFGDDVQIIKKSEFSFKNWMFQDSKILEFEVFDIGKSKVAAL